MALHDLTENANGESDKNGTEEADDLLDELAVHNGELEPIDETHDEAHEETVLHSAKFSIDLQNAASPSRAKGEPGETGRTANEDCGQRQDTLEENDETATSRILDDL